MEQKLGKLEQVELRSIWTSEDKHFTPWLGQAENLKILGEALNIDLEPEVQEKDVGPFRADLLCKNTADNSWVVIENQIENTDHKHLGQLLTYAAGLDAVTIVWIAAEFRDEHRAALDWLNEKTSENIRFFGLEIKLWKIGNSPAAPKFNIMSQPNDWQSNVRESASAIVNTNRSQQLRIKYWSALQIFLKNKGCKLKTQKPSYDHLYTFAIGTGQAHMAALLITREDKIGVKIEISSNSAKEIFAELIKDKAKIEEKVGSSLEWCELPEKKSSKILLFKSCNPYDEDDWPNQFSWLQNQLEKFDLVFRSWFSEYNS